jgi:hypothetical protein
MPSPKMEIAEAILVVRQFAGEDFRAGIAALQHSIAGANCRLCEEVATRAGVEDRLLCAAYTIKKATGRIHEVIHAAGMLAIIPKILSPDEVVECVSLAAGNLRDGFDLVTNKRVAEFKFITWKGGAEAMRHKSLFKDFFGLAEESSNRRKELYVLGTAAADKLLRSNQAIESLTSKHKKVAKAFRQKYPNRFSTVGEYFAEVGHRVEVIDASPLVPELTTLA